MFARRDVQREAETHVDVFAVDTKLRIRRTFAVSKTGRNFYKIVHLDLVELVKTSLWL
jgi:hypothetical protein